MENTKKRKNAYCKMSFVKIAALLGMLSIITSCEDKIEQRISALEVASKINSNKFANIDKSLNLINDEQNKLIKKVSDIDIRQETMFNTERDILTQYKEMTERQDKFESRQKSNEKAYRNLEKKVTNNSKLLANYRAYRKKEDSTSKISILGPGRYEVR